eukprot:SAG22_NODE_2737_length_2263_cov_1.926063_1_plen_166_part_00
MMPVPKQAGKQDRGRQMAAAAAALLLLLCQLQPAAPQSTPPGPLKFPTLFPPWAVEWQLNRSTIAQPCNYSGWFDPELAAQFGVVSFDWANNENSWRSKPQPYPDQADLVTQAELVKKASGNRTKVFVCACCTDHACLHVCLPSSRFVLRKQQCCGRVIVPSSNY